VSALATTDSEFPLQLWDRLTPQVETTLNLMRRSRIDPSKSAHEVLHGPYDWNRFPLAPPGCKAVIYESPAQRGSWGSRGVDAWYLGPSMDHYRCCHYFVPETRAFRISGSAELFPQHCQVPCLTTREHLQGLTTEVVNTLNQLTPTKQQQVLTSLKAKLATHQPKTSQVTARMAPSLGRPATCYAAHSPHTARTKGACTKGANVETYHKCPPNHGCTQSDQ